MLPIFHSDPDRHHQDVHPLNFLELVVQFSKMPLNFSLFTRASAQNATIHVTHGVVAMEVANVQEQK